MLPTRAASAPWKPYSPMTKTAGDCINATSQNITARTSEELGSSVMSWRGVVGGKGACKDYSRVGSRMCRGGDED